MTLGVCDPQGLKPASFSFLYAGLKACSTLRLALLLRRCADRAPKCSTKKELGQSVTHVMICVHGKCARILVRIPRDRSSRGDAKSLVRGRELLSLATLGMEVSR